MKSIKKEVKNMATVVNNQAPVEKSDGSNFVVGIIILAGFGLIVLYFVIPAIQRMGPIQLKVPGTQVVVPDKINVNVQQAK